MSKNVLYYLLVPLIGFILGTIGMLIGATIGGNYFTEFQLGSLRGYEATGQIGFVLGGAAGLALSYRWLTSLKAPKPTSTQKTRKKGAKK